MDNFTSQSLGNKNDVLPQYTHLHWIYDNEIFIQSFKRFSPCKKKLLHISLKTTFYIF